MGTVGDTMGTPGGYHEYSGGGGGVQYTRGYHEYSSHSSW